MFLLSGVHAFFQVIFFFELSSFGMRKESRMRRRRRDWKKEQKDSEEGGEVWRKNEEEKKNFGKGRECLIVLRAKRQRSVYGRFRRKFEGVADRKYKEEFDKQGRGK